MKKENVLTDMKSLFAEIQKYTLFSIKLAAGSSMAIIAAQEFQLDFPSSAGIIAMFTMMSTRRATLRLALIRLISFVITVGFAWTVFLHIGNSWLAYGIFILLLCETSMAAGWKRSLSVNAVIGTHFWSTPDFHFAHVLNELMLVLIGITIAVLLDFFHADGLQKKRLQKNIRRIDLRFQDILEQIAFYLMDLEKPELVWEEMQNLEIYLEACRQKAYEYQENALLSDREYYIRYMDMRISQCKILFSLHTHLRMLRSRPVQAVLIAEYMKEVKEHVTEWNQPDLQMEQLKKMLESFRQDVLPENREEFESRAVLYHVLMDLEEFLLCKKRFLDSLEGKPQQLNEKNGNKY